MANTLYVIFHGLVTVIEPEEGNTFRALLLDMSDHRKAAGHWLTEFDIPRCANLRLSNEHVMRHERTEHNSLTPETNVVIDLSKPGQTRKKGLNLELVETKVWAEIQLPRPKRALTFNRVDISEPRELLTGKDAKEFKVLAGAQVFEYEMTGNHVTLDHQLSKIPFFRSIEDARTNIFTLHILSEPQDSVTDEHMIEEFNLSARLLNSDLQFISPRAVCIPNGDLPKGLRSAELIALADRPDAVYKILHHGADPGAIGDSIVCGGASGNHG